ncbi:MAG: MG2 domain-containing protein [Myxococcaceae bacterium]
MRHVLLLCLVAGTALAEDADFTAADKYLSEQSNARACDGFTAFLKTQPNSPLAREAEAKRDVACTRVGKGNYHADLVTLATTGEKDFARAYAAWELGQRGERSYDDALQLLKQASTGEGRQATQAKQLFLAGTVRQMQNDLYNVKRCEQLCGAALELANAEQAAQLRLLRAQSYATQANRQADAEREYLDLGKGNTSFADNALYFAGQLREQKGNFDGALELYDQIVSRFSPSTSDMMSQAKAEAAEIRRPWIQLSIGTVELPGVKPQVSWSARNLDKDTFQWKVEKVDPFAQKPETAFSTEHGVIALHGSKVSEWSTPVKPSSHHAQVNGNFELSVTEPGAYVLEGRDAAGHTARAFALITTHVTVVKAGGNQAVVWVVDAMTGEAVPNAAVRVFTYDSSSTYRQFDGTTDGTGVARFDLQRKDNGSSSLVVFSKANGSFSYSGGYTNSSAQDYEELLAWVLTDRPLYKPGEKVGIKAFLRSRRDGPSVPVANEPVRLSIRDPLGKEIAKPTLTSNAFGTATFELTVPKNASLGAWSINLEGANRGFNHQGTAFRVEEYKPPEYTVSVTPVTKPKVGAAFKVKVAASFFFGGPVANAQGRALVNISGWQHQWARWPDESEEPNPYGYGYDDEYGYRYGRGYYGGNYFYAQHTLPFKTGADGTAEVEIPAQQVPEGLQGLQYQVTALVTDASRREVQGTATLHVSKAPWFADARTDRFLYKPGEKLKVDLRAEDADGNPASPQLQVRLVRLGENDKVEGTLSQSKAKLTNGRGTVTLDPDGLGAARIELFDADDAKLEHPVATTDLWLTNENKPIIPRTPYFQLLTDRGPLKAGQSIRALIVTNSPGGHALISIETDRINSLQSVEMKGRARFVELKLTPEMVPNAWLTVYRIEKLNVFQQQKPIQVHGGSNELEVKVAFDAPAVEPGQKIGATVNVEGLTGSDKTETAITFVDEALYALAPEPTGFVNWFGRRQRQLYVQTRCSLNERSYRGPPEKRQAPTSQAARNKDEELELDRDKAGAKADSLASANGAPSPVAAAPKSARAMGDDAPADRKAPEEPAKEKAISRGPSGSREQQNAAEPPVKVRQDFGTSAGWFANLAGAGSNAGKVTAALTDSLTSWRATAYVVSGDKLGVGHGSVRAAKPLMVRLEAPRFFTEKDEVTLSAIASSRLATAADVEVTFDFGSQLKPVGAPNGKLHLGPGEDARFDARFKVVEPGAVKLRATVRGAGKADAMEWSLPVVVHGSAQRQFFTGRLKDHQEFDFVLPDKRKPQLTKLELQLSPSVLSAIFDSLPYLAEYPYGCVEQTLSRFVPATIAARTVKDFHLDPSRVPPDLDEKVQAGLKRLYDFQHSDGGWGWWHDDTTNRWMTAYVIYGLSMAKEAGVAVDPGVLERGRASLKSNLGAALHDPETHVWMDFALAKSGAAFKAGLDADFANRTSLSPKGKALLALALQAAKDPRSRIAVENLDDVVKAAASRADASVGEANDSWSTSAAIEQTSYVLMAMAHHDLKSPALAPLTDFLMLRRNGGKWRDTRDTAFAVYALAELARQEGQSARAGAFVVKVNGVEVKRVQFAKGGTGLAPIILADAALKPGKNHVEIIRDSAGTGYWAATFDSYNQNDFIKGVGGDVTLKRTYTLLGKPSHQPGNAETEYGMPVESGVRVRVDLEVKANKAVEYVMVEDLKPAGFEAVVLNSGPEVCGYKCTHAELRTDRVAMFLTELPVGVTHLSYELRAEVPGKFNALPARFEAMYAPEIQATADEMRFEVRDAPENNVARQ